MEDHLAKPGLTAKVPIRRRQRHDRYVSFGGYLPESFDDSRQVAWKHAVQHQIVITLRPAGCEYTSDLKSQAVQFQPVLDTASLGDSRELFRYRDTVGPIVWRQRIRSGHSRSPGSPRLFPRSN